MIRDRNKIHRDDQAEIFRLTDRIAALEAQNAGLLGACNALIAYDATPEWAPGSPGDFDVALDAAKAAIALCEPPQAGEEP